MVRATDWDSNLNLIVYTSILFSALGMAWLSLNNVPSGTRYTMVFLITVSVLFLTFFFIKENQREMTAKLIKNPFSTDLQVASGLYILGWIIPILLQFIIGLVGGRFSVAQIMIPLSAEGILLDVTQSFSVAQAQASPFWQFFVTVFTAGSIEEFSFGFVIVLVMYVTAMLLWNLWNNGKDTNSSTAKNFYMWFALITSALIFGGIHLLNATYVGYMFFVAIMFRLFMNYGIYVLGVFLSFTLGYHQSNNAVWFVQEYGWRVTFDALTSWGGLMILLYFGLILFFVFRNFDSVVSKISKVFSFGG